jgi:hypothetical protein
MPSIELSLSGWLIFSEGRTGIRGFQGGPAKHVPDDELAGIAISGILVDNLYYRRAGSYGPATAAVKGPPA